MASHYISCNKGVSKLKSSDFTVGAASNAGAVFEFRILDGAAVKHLDVETVLHGIKDYLDNAGLVKAGGFDVTT